MCNASVIWPEIYECAVSVLVDCILGINGSVCLTLYLRFLYHYSFVWCMDECVYVSAEDVV
jgi:hypothetical protein